MKDIGDGIFLCCSAELVYLPYGWDSIIKVVCEKGERMTERPNFGVLFQFSLALLE